jgi:hypothetical protein
MLRMSRARRLPFIVTLLSLCCVSPSVASEQIEVDWDEFQDVENEPIDVADAKWTVICFLGAECPLARLYGPRLQQLGDQFARQGVQVV